MNRIFLITILTVLTCYLEKVPAQDLELNFQGFMKHQQGDKDYCLGHVEQTRSNLKDRLDNWDPLPGGGLSEMGAAQDPVKKKQIQEMREKMLQNLPADDREKAARISRIRDRIKGLKMTSFCECRNREFLKRLTGTNYTPELGRETDKAVNLECAEKNL